MRIGGYGAKFGVLSRNLGGFVERVDPGFFNKSRGDGWPDVVARFNHDSNMLLGTTRSGTLRLNVDEVGLDYEVDVPKSRSDIYELVERGDVTQSSFAFLSRSVDDDWSASDQGYPMRTLLSGQLVDVSPLGEMAAYPDATAGLRSLAEKFEADLEEVRSMAAKDELRKFFRKTGDGAIVKPRLQGAAALVEIMGSDPDPWAKVDI
jgi:HK97 family phage prohead protease